MDYNTWKHLNDNGYRPVEYIYKPDNFSNPNFGLGIIAYGNKYGLEVKMQASQEDVDYAMSGHQLYICGYQGLARIDNLPYQNVCTVYIRPNDGYYLGRQTNRGWYTKPDGTITNNSAAHPLIKPCDTDIHIVSTYYDSESDIVKTFLDGVQKATDDSKAWENDLTAGTEYFVYGTEGSGQYTFKGRIYYIKTFDDERNVTGHFIPCVRKSDGRAGLYDVVNSVFKVSTYDYIKAGPNVIVEQIIPWAVGTGNIRLTYTGVGNGTIIAESDENNLYELRTQQITVETTKGSPQQTKTVNISQAARARIDISSAIVTAANQTYSGSAKTPTPTVTLNGDVVPSSGYDVAYSNNTNAGTATITVTGKGEYIGTATGTFTIAKANPNYVAPAAISDLTYSGSSQYLITSGSTDDGTIQYSSNGTSWSTTKPSQTNAGNYTVYWRLVGDSNHNDVSSTSISASIAKASRTLSFAESYVVLDTSSNITKTATPSAGSGDGAITYSISNTTYATINSSSGKVTSKTSDGSAIVTATIAEGTNYLSANASYNLYVFARTHNFDYTGSSQEVTLPAGQYKLQCWGAQGGSNAAASSYSITAKAGGKGGYSEGIITLSTKTTVRMYVGGAGSSSAGGFNGGGSTTGSSSYNSGNEQGISRMGGGGGATDIRLSDGALLSRMIVAGGGGGGAMCYQSKTTSSTSWETVTEITDSPVNYTDGSIYDYMVIHPSELENGATYRLSFTGISGFKMIFYKTTNGWAQFYSQTFTINFNSQPYDSERWLLVRVSNASPSNYIKLEKQVTSEYTDTSNASQVGYVGGGTNGGGYSSSYYGKQNGAGSNGAFGQGADQSVTNYRYCSGAGGGGWYGGGRNYSDSDMNACKMSGGGSGFVNTAASAGNRPSGYTGLQLDSGTTYAGNQSFPNTAGSGNETGHSGNGYAKITRLT